MNIVIMAGGGGTRLWPLSRKELPKQFLDLGSGKTLIEHTYDRAKSLGGESDIFIATTTQYRKKIEQLFPQIAPDHIFYEPERRETAPAFAAAAIELIARGKGEQPTLFLWADHVFTNESALLKDLNVMRELIEKDAKRIVIIGHTPVSPETGFGYMKMGKAIEGYTHVYQIDSFKEKPDFDTAQQYIADGSYFWNIGYMCVLPTFLLDELKQHAPELHEVMMKYKEELEKGDRSAAQEVYKQAPKTPIDYALNEKTKHIVAVTGDYGWSDVGSWAIVKQLFGTDGDHMPRGHHVHVDSHNNYVYNATHKAVSLVGMSDTIVVVTDDAVLVADTVKTQKVKDVVQRLEEQGKKEYL